MKDGTAMTEDHIRSSSGISGFQPLALCLLLSGCNHAPSQNILGSFFPAWMLCAFAGILVSTVIRLLLIKTGIDVFVPAKLPVYGGLAVALTLLLWFLWFGN